ncbi:MAG: hypothetical protein AAGN35_13635 [Bacteroidota bacterium]
MYTYAPTGPVTGPTSRALYRSFRALIIALQTSLCFTSLSHACPTQTRTLDQCPLEIRILSDAPGTVRIQLIAGTAARPAQNLLGLDVQFDFDAHLTPAATADFHSINTWPTRDGQFSARLTCHPDSGKIDLHFRRTACASVSGHGLLGEILVKGISEPLDPEELVRVSAGLVLEEIVNGARSADPGLFDQQLEDDLRPGPTSPAVGPIPASDHLNVHLETGAHLQLHNAAGQTVYTHSFRTGGLIRIDLRGIPRGQYWLRIRRNDGTTASQCIPILR